MMRGPSQGLSEVERPPSCDPRELGPGTRSGAATDAERNGLPDADAVHERRTDQSRIRAPHGFRTIALAGALGASVVAAPLLATSLLQTPPFDTTLRGAPKAGSTVVGTPQPGSSHRRSPDGLSVIADEPRAAPQSEGATPPAEGTTPPAEGTTPPAESTTPPAEGTTPPAESTTPPAERTTPPAANPNPPATTAATAASAIDNTSARRERTRTAAEDTLRKALVPQPMSQARFIALLAAIDPALAADATLLEAHAGYLASVEKLNEASIRQLLRLLPAAYSWDAGSETFEPRSTPELIALLGLRDKAARNTSTAERRLLQAVDTLVPADARNRYNRALLAWRHESMPRAALLPSTRVTLVELLAEAKLGPESGAAIEQVVGDYAGALASACAERAQLLRDNDASRAVIETTAGALWRYAPEEIAAATAAELDELDARDFASEIAIRTLHFDALARIRARLQPREGRRVVELWQRTVHPELFDDERLLARMVEDTLAHPNFSADHDTALLDALETSYQRLEPLSRAACEAADLVLPRLPSRTQESMAAEIDARIVTLETQEKRRAVVKEALQRVRAMLGDADAGLAARLEDAIFSADSLARADAFERRALALRREALAPEREAIADEQGAAGTPAAKDGGSAASPAGPAVPPSTRPGSPGDGTKSPAGADGNGGDGNDDATQPARNGRGGRRARPN